MNNIEIAIRKLKLAISRIITEYPFFSRMVMLIDWEISKAIPTACATNIGYGKVFVNPEWFNSLKEDERIFVILHEILHLALKHVQRGRDKIPHIWNIATDLTINNELLRITTRLVLRNEFENAMLLPKKFGFEENLSAETYYDLLIKESREQIEKTLSQMIEDLGKKSKEIEGEIGELEKELENTKKELEENEKKTKEIDKKIDKLKSKAEGLTGEDKKKIEKEIEDLENEKKKAKEISEVCKERIKELEKSIKELEKELNEINKKLERGVKISRDIKGRELSESEIEEIFKELFPTDELKPVPATEEEEKKYDEEWKRAIVEGYEQTQRMRGTLPGNIEGRLFEPLKLPKMDWKTMLKTFCTQVIRIKYDWSRPSRRYLPLGVYYPTRRTKILNLVVAVDVSGSISDAEIVDFFSEINGILNSFTAYHIYLIQCDAQIQGEVLEIRYPAKLDYTKVKIMGRGGTDFRPVFKYLEEKNIRYPVIYFTDLFGEFPEKDPGVPVLWITVGKEEAPFGLVVKYPKKESS